jgi:hypothetical protein
VPPVHTTQAFQEVLTASSLSLDDLLSDTASLRALVLYHVLNTESRFLHSLKHDGERLGMYNNHGVLVKKG